jgi:diacylglycerol kinase
VKKPKWDVIGLTCALRGIKHAVISERNLKIHMIAIVLVVIAAVIFPVSATEILILIITGAAVIVAELLNTAIEKVVDLVCTEHNEKAMLAKDIAAGAVVVTAIMAVAVGVIIFLPKVIERFS